MNDGLSIPILGMGTYEPDHVGTFGAVADGLRVGYRHLDSASKYDNEDQVGRAIAASGVSRQELFYTTKLDPTVVTEGGERGNLERSLGDTGLDYVDLWLIHWPPNEVASPSAWRALIDAREDGLARSIGVSNYSLAEIDELSAATGVVPAINQIEWSPTLFSADILAGHRDRGVALTAWSPFKSTNLSAPVLEEVAAGHGKTVPQVLVRWNIQHDVVVIPKSFRESRLRENLDVFDFALTGAEMDAIDAMGER
jgi:diketogulonate reductase-like aldo/keto reductase